MVAEIFLLSKKGIVSFRRSVSIPPVEGKSEGKLAGILLPAFSPRREGDLGIGDTLAMRQWIDWAAEHHIGFIQLLPIHENGTEESPYSGISSVALDPIYLACDPSEIPGIEESHLENAREKLKGDLDSPLINYPAVRAVKRNLLELAWANFQESNELLINEFHCFLQKEYEWIDDYRVFRFLMDLHGPELTWDQWPVECRTPASARSFVKGLLLKDPVGIKARLDFFAFVQWLCFRQWLGVRAYAEKRGVKLMGDIPIGISWHSCDVFFARDEFHLDWYGGSPPEGMGHDPSFLQQWGQNWGIPLYRWEHMQSNGFLWWRKRIARLTMFFQIFRLDHILGFYRIYAFPWRPERNHEFMGMDHHHAASINGGRLPQWFQRPDDTPENKAANRDDGDVRLRAIVEAAGNADVIAEDLGWVPDYVRPHLAELGIAGFRIPHWDCNEHGHPTPGNHFPENTFAAYSTHDHQPINGIWRSCLRAIRQQLETPSEQGYWSASGSHNTLRILSEFADIPVPHDGRWPSYTEGVHLRLLKALFDSNSRYAVIMITELFDMDDQFNHPGSSGGTNWRLRLPWTIREIEENPQLASTCQKMATLISITRRSPKCPNVS